MPEKLQCYSCGAENPIGARFCISCGEQFFYKCPQCGTGIEPGFDFCSNCGAKLDWGTSKKESIDVDADVPLQNEKALKKNEQDSVTSNQEETPYRAKRRGLNPWFIAFIIIVILIVAIFVIDALI